MAAEPQLISVSQYELFRDDFNSIDVAQAGTIDSCQMAQLLEKQLGYKLSPAQASSLITGIERDRRGNTTLVGYLNMLLGAGWKVEWEADAASQAPAQPNALAPAEFVVLRVTELVELCNQLSSQQISAAAAATTLRATADYRHPLLDSKPQIVAEDWLQTRPIAALRRLPPAELLKIVPQLSTKITHDDWHVREHCLQVLALVPTQELRHLALADRLRMLGSLLRIDVVQVPNEIESLHRSGSAGSCSPEINKSCFDDLARDLARNRRGSCQSRPRRWSEKIDPIRDDKTRAKTCEAGALEMDILRGLLCSLPPAELDKIVPQLVAKLELSDPAMRKQAVQLLGWLPELHRNKVGVALVSRMWDSKWEVRQTTAAVLRELPVSTLECQLPELMTGISHKDVRVRCIMLQLLTRLPAASLVKVRPQLLLKLQDESSVKQCVLQLLESLPKEQLDGLQPELLPLLEDESADVQADTIRLLGQLPAAALGQLAPKLMEKLHHNEQTVQRAVIQALGNLPEAEQAKLMVDVLNMLQHDDQSVRWAALQLISLWPPQLLVQCVPHVNGALKDDHAIVRSAAATALRQLPEGELSQMLPQLLMQLEDSESSVRKSMVELLTTLPIHCLSAVLPQVVDRVEHGDSGVRHAATEALVGFPYEELIKVLPQLVSKLDHDHWQVRKYSLQVLACLPVHEQVKVLPQLLRALNDTDWCIRRDTVLMLSHMPPEHQGDVVPKLVPLLSDDDWSVRAAVVQVLSSSPLHDVVLLVPQLVAKLRFQPDSKLRRSVLALLQKLPASQLDRALLESMVVQLPELAPLLCNPLLCRESLPSIILNI